MIVVSLHDEAWEGVDATVEALVDKWLVQVGDTVKKGQPLADVVLVKASQQVVAPADGRIGQILVGAGDTFARGKPMATLERAP